MTLSSLPSTSVVPSPPHQFPSHIHAFLFCFVAHWFYPGRLCGHRLGAVHWSLVGTPSGTQLMVMTVPLQSPSIASSSGGRTGVRWAPAGTGLPVETQSCAGLVQAATAALRACLQWLCHALKIGFCSPSPCLLLLTTLLPPLPQCPRALEGLTETSSLGMSTHLLLILSILWVTSPCIHCHDKLLWLRLTVMFVYDYKHKYLHCSSVPC